jgi:hypothetical protein
MTLRTDLDTLQRDLDVTQSTLHNALVSVYPIGKSVRVAIVRSGKPPRSGTVIAHGTGRFSGQVRLRLDTPTKQVRDFHWRMIV